MQDVADEAGVSLMTVSRILRGSPYHRTETRERVLDIAQRIGYRKNPFLAELLSQRRKCRSKTSVECSIGLVHFQTQGASLQPNQVSFREAVKKRAAELSGRVETIGLKSQNIINGRLYSILRARGCCGVIFENLGDGVRPDDQDEIQLDMERIAVVSIGNFHAGSPFRQIDVAHCGNVRLALRMLMKSGHKRIGLIESSSSRQQNQGRRMGCFLDYQMDLLEEWRVPVLMAEPDGSSNCRIEHWLREHRPDVVISSDDLIIDAVSKFKETAISLAHLDWHPGLKGIPGVCQNWDAIGRMAVDDVFECITQRRSWRQRIPFVAMVNGNWVSSDA
jgi:LacI family transcriptional regulator